MRVIAVVNMKGGVAKTTTVINVAAILAKDYKQRVLLVDADSQCNTTEFFGGDPTQGNLAELLRIPGEKLHLPAEPIGYIQESNFDGVDLLCGADELMDLDLSKVEGQEVNVTVLRDLRQTLLALSDEDEQTYDWILVDCPPAFNAASAAALVMAEEVLIPIKLDAFSLRGMTNLLHQIESMRKINPKLRLLGCLPTMWYSCDRTEEAMKVLEGIGLPLLPPIRRTDKVDDMTYVQEPLLVSSPRSAAGVDYRRFVRDLMKGGFRNG